MYNPDTDGLELPDGSLLYFTSARGIYIPRDFVNEINRNCITNVKDEDLEILKDPDHKWYWGAWMSVMDNAIIVDHFTGNKYTLYQDGDLWLIPIESEL